LQLALLAPGWVHGCLGLWISLRRVEAIRSAWLALLAVMIGIPLLATLGFWRMAVEAPPLASPSAAVVSARQTLATWHDHLLTLYLTLVAAALLVGRLRALMARPTV
jgi:adenylate cyclase